MIGKTVGIYCLNEESYLDGRYICLLPNVKGFKRKWKDIFINDKTIKKTYTVIKNVRYV